MDSYMFDKLLQQLSNIEQRLMNIEILLDKEIEVSEDSDEENEEEIESKKLDKINVKRKE